MKKSTLSRIFTAAIIAFSALLCLTACGDDAQSQSENSADNTTASTVLTTTASDESEDITTTTAESKTTTTTAQTTAVTEATTTAQTTTTAVTTTTVAQTTTAVTTISSSELDIPSTAVTIPIDTNRKITNANDMAIVLLDSFDIDSTGVNIENTTDAESFAEDLQSYLDSISSEYSVILGYTDYPTSPLSRVTDENRIFGFFGTNGPVIIWGADIETKTIYGINSDGVVVYTLEDYLYNFGEENYEIYMT